MNSQQRLEQLISHLVQERLHELHELDEISTSSGAGAYLTPMAFSGGTSGGKKKQRQNAQQLGWKLTKAGADAVGHVDRLSEAVSRYHRYKTDPRTPRHKIGRSISEINKHLDEIGKMISMNARLKREVNVTTSSYWKRTMEQIGRIENKLLRIAHDAREMKI